MSNLTLETQKLIKIYQDSERLREPAPEGTAIAVDEIASKVAAFYEKIRRIIDWKEEHLMRQAAIRRSLKRRILIEGLGTEVPQSLEAGDVAEPLVVELIRSGHFPNNQIPQSRIDDVRKVLEKYIYILKYHPASPATYQDVTGLEGLPAGGSALPLSAGRTRGKMRFQLHNWLLEIASCEVEEILDPDYRTHGVINYMTENIAGRLKVVPEGTLTENEKFVLTYIGVHQALFHLDEELIGYHLVRYQYPQWDDLPLPMLQTITQHIYSVWESVETAMSHPLSNKFFGVCGRYDTIYLLLGDVLKMLGEASADVTSKMSEPRMLANLIRRVYNERLSTLKNRLFRAAVYSTLSIFVAGAVSLFIVEVPLAKLVYGRFSPLAVAVDLLGPTALMFLLVALVKPPKQSNLDKIVAETNKIVYSRDREDIYEIRIRKERGAVWFIISVIYAALCVLSVAVTAWLFDLSGIPITSVILDTVNVGVVVAAALVIRQRAKELTVEEKASFWAVLLDILSVPAARVGQWFSDKWRQYNVLSVFFNALIDMPLVAFIEFVEDWNRFIREKKEEIR